MNYIPFLKFKVNEVGAIKELSKPLKENLTPFFDLPRRDDLDETKLINMINLLHRKYEINLKDVAALYIDNFDIDDAIKIYGKHNYYYLLNKFGPINLIPVVGIDRSDEHNQAVFDYARVSLISTVAIRITNEYLDYSIYEQDIEDLIQNCLKSYKYIHLIIDNRICLNVDINDRAKEVNSFIDNINSRYILSKIIVTGSSIPASIRDLLIPGYSNDFQRAEIDLYRIVKKRHSSIFLGDYTVVSPNYSDVQLEKELLRKVTAPKLFYAYHDKMYIARGHALETHPRGNKQYNDLCAIVVGKSFYRTPLKSFGDKYLHEKANNIGKDATPSTIPKPLVNLHITYMLTDFVF